MKYVLFFIFCITSSMNASAQVYKTQFLGWVGKQQQSRFVDGSVFHVCYNNSGGQCGNIALTTGKSTCFTRGFNLGVSGTQGAKWELPVAVPGLQLSGQVTVQWQACNIRQETITCSPNPGWKGQAAILVGDRVGRTKITGVQNNTVASRDGKTCPRGFVLKWLGKSGYACNWNGGTWEAEGYLPEFRYSTCNYQRI